MCQEYPAKVEAVDCDEKGVSSYSQQFSSLKGCANRDVINTAYPKPSRRAQAKEPGATRLPYSSIYTKSEQRPLLDLPTDEIAPFVNKVVHRARLASLLAFHLIAIFIAPKHFSWRNVGLAAVIYGVPGIFGITLGYHRLLTHKSFKCYKWFEYFCAWMGVQAGQGDPIEWVSHHRYHHLHTDTPLDPHSPYEGFWWAHITWLFKTEVWLLDHANVRDLTSQTFYRVLQATWLPWLFVIKPLITYKLGGMEMVAWTLAVPMVYGWHVTFLVNSAAHVWGRRSYSTGDLSTNCWWVAALSFGEGWHNSHHAFPYSARHGLEWWEVDLTWILVCLLEKLGIVWDVQVPNEKAKAAKRVDAAGRTPGKKVAFNITAKAA